MRKYLIQIVIGIGLYLLIPLISSNSNTSDVIKYLVGAIPVIYSLVLYTYYKPKNYLKFLIINSRNKDVGYLYRLSIKDYIMTKESFDNIKELLFKMENNEMLSPRLFTYDCGVHKYKAIFNNGLFNFDLDYSVGEKVFVFECTSNLTYRRLIRRLSHINERLMQNLNSATYDIKMHIEFLNENKTSDSRNPFVNNIFNDFTKRNLTLSYVAKRGTKVTISNNKISFQSDNLDGISYDLSNEITLLKGLSSK